MKAAMMMTGDHENFVLILFIEQVFIMLAHFWALFILYY